MLIKIKEIGDNGLSLNLPVTAAWLAAECPNLGAVPGPKGFWVRGQLTESNDDVFLRGRLRGELDTTCVRCLEPAKVHLDVPLALTFMPRPDHQNERPGKKKEDDDEEDDVDVALYDGDEIDLGPEIRDQVMLAYPISPLCREDCAGLCAVCGGNRNLKPCGCEARQAPSQKPFAAVLGKLKL